MSEKFLLFRHTEHVIYQIAESNRNTTFQQLAKKWRKIIWNFQNIIETVSGKVPEINKAE
jgi:hypothetical protein